AALLAGPGWAPDPGRILFAGGGRQAIAGAVAALVPPGGRLGVEALTYPVLKGIAARLGVTLVPLAMDEDGVRPDAIATAHRTVPLAAVYLQPTLQNPVTTTMPARRRTELARLLGELDLGAIEDGVWRFLDDGHPPLAALAPEHVVHVDGMSKRVAPGLNLGFVVPPAGRVGTVAGALRSGSWLAARFPMEAATRWVTDGTVARLQLAKRGDAAARQRVVAERLAGFRVRADPHGYSCWWELPSQWRADAFASTVARRGIAIVPAAGFAVGTDRPPNAVRLALATPPIDTLHAALAVLADTARADPAEHVTE
ncbi:MAG: PLP-dependent aminotransferase family protein, partial [Actinocatenispora sp.]